MSQVNQQVNHCLQVFTSSLPLASLLGNAITVTCIQVHQHENDCFKYSVTSIVLWKISPFSAKQLRDKKNTMKISRETLSARDIAFRDKTLYMLLTYIGRVVPSQGQRVHRVTMQQRLECELCTRDTRFCWQGGDKRQMGGGWQGADGWRVTRGGWVGGRRVEGHSMELVYHCYTTYRTWTKIM